MPAQKPDKRCYLALVKYEWQKSYLTTVLETDSALIEKRAAEATAVMHTRIQEIERNESNKGSFRELVALEEALRGIQVLCEEMGRKNCHSSTGQPLTGLALIGSLIH